MADARPRQIAFRALRRASAGDFLEHRLESDPAFRALPGLDRRLAQELLYGVTRHRATLDWLVARRTEGRPQRPEVQDLLRMGLYQLFWLERIPAHAAVHETVEVARAAGLDGAAGFINAILRGCERERAMVLQSLGRLRQEDPATGYSHPRWLVERWQAQHGDEGLRRLLEWDNTPPPTYARLNTLRATADATLAQWREEGVESRPFERPWLPSGLVHELLAHPSLASLPSFQSGGIYVQDPSTLMAGLELGARPGETILDYCAAPGGKATWIAQLTSNQARVVAHDNHAGRLRLLEENATRLGATSIVVAPPPHAPGTPGTFDRVLVDAPCSNTGVLRRRLELRWRLEPSEVERLAAAQVGLLDRAARMVRPGGTLVYSTCSLEPEENHAVARSFAATHPGWRLEKERSLTPLADGTDGAFVAVLVRDGA
ncbi:MAG: 16S rRNA (cytosine(967)-C(5))-methyltransferase RsmB [Verrucomicrobiota bacterium]